MKIDYLTVVTRKCNTCEAVDARCSEPRKGGLNMSRNLVVYFSASGNTKKFAETIAKLTGADIKEIIPEKPYVMDYSKYDEIAAATKAERDRGDRPAIRNLEDINIRDYDNIFIGYPMWWYTLPMIMFTFFEAKKDDFAGKTVIPFNTHEGSGDGGTYPLVADLAKGAHMLPGLAIRGLNMKMNQTHKIKKWLSKIGFSAAA